MPALMPSQIPDFVETTLNNIKRKKWVDISAEYPHYEFTRHFKKKLTPEDGGEALQWEVQIAHSDNTAYTGLFDVDTHTVESVMTNAQVPWSMQKNNFTFDVREKIFQGGDVTKIVDYVKVREHSMYTDFFEFMEKAMWTSPANASITPTPINGIPYYIVKNSSTTPGFNGGAPTGHTTVANLSPTTYANWRNWTFVYSQPSRTDLVRKVLEATEKTHFQAAHSYAELDGGMPDWVIYTTFSVWNALKELQEGRNDNLGNDVGYMSGKLVINGIPVRWVPALTSGDVADTSNPVYGVNWRKLKFFFQRGMNMVRSKPIRSADSHNVQHVYLDNSCNYKMTDRRSSFVGYVV
jgi:hypothetical protein